MALRKVSHTSCERVGSHISNRSMFDMEVTGERESLTGRPPNAVVAVAFPTKFGASGRPAGDALRQPSYRAATPLQGLTPEHSTEPSTAHPAAMSIEDKHR